MDGRRRQRFEFHDQQPRRSRSGPKKPPLGTWLPKVPTWEKQFCHSVGSVSWEKVLDAKRTMHLFQDVVKWNDCAVEEAYNNAKKRYWAWLNGKVCDIPLPDPDIYIDQIDWNSEVDPELVSDLECNSRHPTMVCEDAKGVGLTSSFLLNQSFSCTGWGNEEDFPKELDMNFAPQNGGDHVQCEKNSWEQDCPLNETAKNHGWGAIEYCNGTRKDDGWGSEFNKFRDWRHQREDRSEYMSRYKTSRFLDNGYQNRKGWKTSNIACR